MNKEQQNTLEGLKTAIQMEKDGKKFYLQASRISRNEMGKKLLESLSVEEDYHRSKFEEIYAAIKKEMNWPEVEFQPEGGDRLQTIFSGETGVIDADKESLSTEIDTVQEAMDKESETREFYLNQAEKAEYPPEKEFYDKLAAEERKHFLALLDYFEYLKDPAAWFVEKEHPILDGG